MVSWALSGVVGEHGRARCEEGVSKRPSVVSSWSFSSFLLALVWRVQHAGVVRVAYAFALVMAVALVVRVLKQASVHG